MATSLRTFRVLARPAARCCNRATVSIPAISLHSRHHSSKHPAGFEPPTSEDLSELRERVQDFTRREIPEELAAHTDKTNAFPNEMWKKMGDAVMEEISRASGSIGLSYAAHSQLCVNQIQLNGSPEQKRKYLPGLISGDLVGALAMSESGAGSDVVSMRTTAKKVDGGYVLNGSKMWITNGPDAHLIVVYAKTEPDKGSRGITAFLVQTDYKGFSCARKLDKMGMRGSNTGELMFDSVFVPDENVMGDVNGGVKLLGGMGYMEEMPASRLLRDAKLYEIGAGTSEIRRMVIGRAFNKEYANA
ncbi:unnamed protein product [Clonostachys rosea f. rosea IK726]|uniref:Acyl-CoA oxidase/dehydrogenase middle domain-containing protein n=2 Tax=Bionectria ochroleuca TaxID=29856 RepID=A0A0B7K866_BIOOC|nr:unnamed protein product [Clonostachys rosea f. rosea IK726]